MSAERYMLQLEATAAAYYRMARNSMDAARDPQWTPAHREWLRYTASNNQLIAAEISKDVREYFERE